MTGLLVAAGIILALILLNAFFSLAETALTASSRARMRSLENEGDAAAARVNRLTEDREQMIGAVLLGANFVAIAASSVSTTVFNGLYGEQIGGIISVLVLTPLLLIFGEVLPKTYAISAADKMARGVALPIEVMVRLLGPVVAGVQIIVRQALAVFGVKIEDGVDILAARDEIRGAVELHAEEGAVESDVRDRLRGALDLGELTVADVMVHRKNMKLIDADAPPREVLAQAMASTHTRHPLYKGEPENIVGVLHARDLLRAVSEKGRDGVVVEEVMRPPWFVPDTTKAEDQLAEFLRRRQHFALVVDEYGALQGLVTLEDILEEIVGDIRDEHDIAVQGLRPQGPDTVHVDGWLPIRDLNRAMNWDLPDEEAVTVAGLVMHEAEAIPEPGQVFAFHGYRFHILRRTRNQIQALRVERVPEEEEAA